MDCFIKLENPGRVISIGGERGIRTLDTVNPYNGLANRRLQPLGHLSKSYDHSTAYL